MQNLHQKLTQKYPKYNNWHQTKHHNKIHWGVLVVFTILVFGMILRWTPISFAADIAAPTTPTNLAATPISSSQINLSWTASTDNVGVAGYKIYRCAGLSCSPTTQIATSATNSYSSTSLIASTTYTYAVSAYDAAGNESGKSASVSVTTQAQTGAVYYVDDDAPNDTGDGSITNPKKYITSALQLMNGGDTLIIKDGIYTGANNMIGDYASPQVWPPSGLGPNQYTVIKAENIGGAIIDGEYRWAPFSTFNRMTKVNYVRVEGIHFRRGSCSVFNIKGDYNKILRSGFEDGQSPTDARECPIAFIAGGSSYSLVEDAWVWGKGRYGFFTAATSGTGGTNHIIFRRIVVRTDDTPPGWVTGGINFYWGDTNVCQNCIVIDSTPNPNSVNYGALYMTGGSYTGIGSGSINHSYYGSIALNNKYWWGFAPEDSRHITTVENTIFWKNGSRGWGVLSNSGGTFNINHVISGYNNNSGYWSHPSYPTIENVSNSIAVNNATYGLSYIKNPNTVNVYGNTSGDCEGCTITNSITTNPFTAASGFSNPALKYLPQIEANSNLKGAATDGGDVGATILKKIGVSQTLYGETGWDQTTDEDLWPWPDEGIWTPKLRSYNASGPGGNRGFAADGMGLYGGPITLTSYIWEYLGNPCPTGICVAIPDITAPTTPTTFTATAVSSSQINLSWTASEDNVGVAGYKIYRCAGSGCAPTIQIATSATNSYSNNGLAASTAYTYTVSAYDAAGNESGKSGSVSATTLSQFKPSDLNQDRKVDQLDFDILKQDWNRTDKPVSDLNQDGVVDSRDLGIMMSEWTR